MFTDSTERASAIALCNPNGGGDDSNPEARRECYFDFLVRRYGELSNRKGRR